MHAIGRKRQAHASPLSLNARQARRDAHLLAEIAHEVEANARRLGVRATVTAGETLLPHPTPVGGTYTIDPQQARQVARQLNDPAILPMHYRRGPLGFPELQELEEFLSLYPSSAIQRLSGPIWQAAAAPGSVIVPCFSE